MKFEVDNSKPTTKINIRLHNGDSITQEFNLNKNLNENSENWVKHSAVIKNLFESLKHSEDIK